MIERGVARNGAVEIAFDVRGEGPCVLLAMGLGGRAADWNDAFTDRLARRLRVARFDNRGAGRSSKPKGPYSIELLAADALAVIDALSVARAHLVGFSMGGMIAQQLALDHAARVERLVLVATHEGGARVVPPTSAALAAMTARGKDARAVVHGRVGAIAAPGFAASHPELVEAIVDIALAEPMPMQAFVAQAQAVAEGDRSGRLHAITAPTLVVHGVDDPLVPIENGRRLAREIVDAELVELAGVGHLPMWEAPEALADAIERFLFG